MGKLASFRWVGRKEHLAPRLVPGIREHLAEGGKLISPFFGSGALEMAAGLPGERIIAAEANVELRFLFRALGEQTADEVWWALQDLDHLTGRGDFRSDAQRVAAYRRVRSMQVGPQNVVLRAARLLWLQSYCFNGLWRENASYQHNVPPDRARLKRPPRATKEGLALMGEAARGIRLYGDWREALAVAIGGDLAIVDPPYLKTFSGYSGGGFCLRHHEELAAALRKAVDRGVAVIAFNSPDAAALYSWAQIERVPRSGRISSKGSGRQSKEELIITAGPLRVRRAA